MAGRRPRPTHLKLIDGTHRRDRHGEPGAEPRPRGDVIAPRWLKGRAARAWLQYAPELIRLKILTAIDIHVFALWCQLAARSERGSLTAAEMSQFRALGTEFGIGASSRAKLGMQEKAEPKPGAEYLR